MSVSRSQSAENVRALVEREPESFAEGRSANERSHVRKDETLLFGSGFVKIIRDNTDRGRAEAERVALLERERAARAEAEAASSAKDEFRAPRSHIVADSVERLAVES